MSNDNFYDSDEVDELIRQIVVSDEPIKESSMSDKKFTKAWAERKKQEINQEDYRQQYECEFLPSDEIEPERSEILGCSAGPLI